MASRITRKRWKAVAVSAAVGAGVFALLAHLDRPVTLRTTAMAVVLGLILGTLAAPDIEPKLFRSPEWWQAAVGAAGGAVLAVWSGANLGMIVAAAIAGGGLGALARHWVKYV